MGYYSQPERIPTLLEALNNLTVDRLKALANLLSGGKIPTRKAELVSYIQQQLPKILGRKPRHVRVAEDGFFINSAIILSCKVGDKMLVYEAKLKGTSYQYGKLDQAIRTGMRFATLAFGCGLMAGLKVVMTCISTAKY